MKYRCVYISGGGTEYEEGVFEETRRTKTTLTLTMVEEGFYCMYPSKTVRRIPLEGGTGDRFSRPVTHWGDGSFTVYHEQAGTPYIYTPESDPA